MRVEQTQLILDNGWGPTADSLCLRDADVVFVFGGKGILQQPGSLDALHQGYPQALMIGCSTAGEIHGTSVSEDTISATAVRLDKSSIRSASIRVAAVGESFAAGRRLAGQFDREGLAHVLVFADGLNVNGSELVRGLSSVLPVKVTLTGGLAADGDRFQETLVVWKDTVESKNIAVAGLYGDSLRIGCGSQGGWDSFGPERLITRSEGNVLYELDGKSALDLYKDYLGEQATGLPATGLLFPLSIRSGLTESSVVRTILSVDEQAKSLTFAGDVPRGSFARLMKANVDRLIDGAVGAATASYEAIGAFQPDLALLISCVGRKMVLKQRIEEEVEGVADVLGPTAPLMGFYSYGEISPFVPGAKCELHNQTMTITTFAER